LHIKLWDKWKIAQKGPVTMKNRKGLLCKECLMVIMVLVFTGFFTWMFPCGSSVVKGAVGGADYFTGEDNEDNQRSGQPDNDMDMEMGVGEGDPNYPIEFNILVSGQLPKASAVLYIRAYDVDDKNGEIDKVYFNEHFVGKLWGADRKWSICSFNVDPAWVRQGINTVELLVQGENGKSSGGKLNVDWGQLSIDGGVKAKCWLEDLKIKSINIGTTNVNIKVAVSIKAETEGSYFAEVWMVGTEGNSESFKSKEFSVSGGETVNQDFEFDLNKYKPTGMYTIHVNLLDTASQMQLDAGQVVFKQTHSYGPALDTNPPCIVRVFSASGDGIYEEGSQVLIDVELSEMVNVWGEPRLLLETGDVDRYAIFAGKPNDKTLRFEYIVQPGDQALDLQYAGTSALELAGGSIKDSFGNNASLDLPDETSPESLAGGSSIVVHTNRPPDAPAAITSLAAGVLIKGGEPIPVSWQPALDPDQDAVTYHVEIFDGILWREVYRGSDTSFTYDNSSSINTAEAQFRVCAKDNKGASSLYCEGPVFAIDSFGPSIPNLVLKAGEDIYIPNEWTRQKVSFTLSESEDNFSDVVYQYSLQNDEWITGQYGSVEEEGIYVLSYRAVDQAGNLSGEGKAEILIDRTPPSGSININKSAECTSNHKVTIDFEARDSLCDALWMQVSNNDLFEQATWTPYNMWIPWQLEDGEGERTVYVRFMDGAGNQSAIYWDTIYVDTTAPVITLLGSETITLEVGERYNDPGALAEDYYDGDLNERIIVTNSVNPNILGTYTVVYNVADSAGNNAQEVVRTVHVVDTTPPVIHLNGEPDIYIELGSEYNDPGASARDNYNGDLTYKIRVDGTVDTGSAGTYIIRYNVTDNNGNDAAQAVRRVHVVDSRPVEGIRMGGSNRYDTSTKISEMGWSYSTEAILTAGDGDDRFADALAGAPLGFQLDVPLLLTQYHMIPNETKTELQRLGVKKVYVLGGPGAVSDDVVKELRQSGYQVERLWGQNRYETAVSIADKLCMEQDPGKVFLTSGTEYLYAVMTAPLAARERAPILFTQVDRLNPQTRRWLEDREVVQVEIVGGQDIISNHVAEELRDMGILVSRIEGDDLTEINLELIHKYGLTAEGISLARDDIFVDALAGAVLAARMNYPIVLTDPWDIDSRYLSFFSEKQYKNYIIFGGEGAISEQVEQLSKSALSGEKLNKH
jgi:putative cell wall-binding protein